MVVIALSYILYLTVDITIYTRKRNKYLNSLRTVQEEMEMKETSDGNYHLNISLPKFALIGELGHHYCLMKDAHSASIYLKIGAAGEQANAEKIL